MLPQEQIENIKKQLISQLENTQIPNKEETKNNIINMNSEQLEEFLIKNNLIKTQQTPQETSKTPQCIFCSIISGDIQSHIINENESAIVVLEINPISRGHILVIPKKHAEKIPKTIFNFAQKIAKEIKTKLKPKNIIISSSNLFGHEIINILPVYKDETLNSERKQAKSEELEDLKKLLEKKPKKQIIKKPKIEKLKESETQKLWLPRRIP